MSDKRSPRSDRTYRIRDVLLRVTVVVAVVTATGLAAPATVAADAPEKCTHADGGNESDDGDRCDPDPCDRPHVPEKDCDGDPGDIIDRIFDLLGDLFEMLFSGPGPLPGPAK